MSSNLSDYIKSSLRGKDERIITSPNTHSIVWFSPLFKMFLYLILGLVLFQISSLFMSALPPIPGFFGLPISLPSSTSLLVLYFIFVALYMLFKISSQLLDSGSKEIALTNYRIVIRTGGLSTETNEFNLDKVESVTVRKSFAGSMLGYGDMIITGVGGSRYEFHSISNPSVFRSKFNDASIKYIAMKSSRNSSSPHL